jgi:acyl-CoA oxidase
LFGLTSRSEFTEDAGWFLSFKFFAPNKAKAIHEEVNKLCLELRPHASSLIDSFGIPKFLVQSPMADEDWVQKNAYEVDGPHFPK